MPWYDDPDMWSIIIRDPSAPDAGTVYRYLGRRFAQRFQGPDNDNPSYYLGRADWLIARLSALGLDTSHRILIVGAAWGYLLAAFRLRGYVNTWGLEIDNYFIANHATEALPDADVSTALELGDIRDITKQQLKAKLIQRTGDWQFHVILTDDVATNIIYADSDLATIANACEAALLGTDTRRIIHLVTDVKLDVEQHISPAFDTYGRRLTLAEWSAKRPAHTWVSLIDGETIVGTV